MLPCHMLRATVEPRYFDTLGTTNAAGTAAVAHGVGGYMRQAVSLAEQAGGGWRCSEGVAWLIG